MHFITIFDHTANTELYDKMVVTHSECTNMSQGCIAAHEDEVTAMSFIASGPQLTVATSSHDQTSCLWDVTVIAMMATMRQTQPSAAKPAR